jgi:hypothetical protein
MNKDELDDTIGAYMREIGLKLHVSFDAYVHALT